MIKNAKNSADTSAKDGNWKEYPKLLWRGIAMGMAEVIPGVSGGTVALITGILQRFVEAIHSVNGRAVKFLLKFKFKELFEQVHWKFLFMLFSGQFVGVMLFTRVIPLPRLLREYPEPMLGLFFGLILGSIFILARSAGLPKFSGILSYLLGGMIGALVVAGIQSDTPETPWFIFIVGAIAICAWILPGISGSFVLLLLHKYDYVWEAVTMHNSMPIWWNITNVILPFGLGAVIGLASFSRVLSMFMNKYPKNTTMAMTGLLLASLWAIFPFQNPVYQAVASGSEKFIGTHPYLPGAAQLAEPLNLLAIALAIFGCAFVIILDNIASKKKQ